MAMEAILKKTMAMEGIRIEADWRWRSKRIYILYI